MMFSNCKKTLLIFQNILNIKKVTIRRFLNTFLSSECIVDLERRKGLIFVYHITSYQIVETELSFYKKIFKLPNF